MKKFLSAILVLAMSLTLLAIPASAATSQNTSTVKVWSGKVNTKWYTGKKTTYEISTAEQLAGLQKLVADGYSMEGITIELTSDIVLNKNAENYEDWLKNPPANKWKPIGYSEGDALSYKPFAGKFNGNGHSISGAYVNDSRCAGIFGYIYGAKITGLMLKDSYIIGYNSKGTVYAGGIAAIMEMSVIDQCENRALVYAQGPKSAEYGSHTAIAGGIAGIMKTENLSAVLFAGTLAAVGYVANPMLFVGNGGTIKSSLVQNCVNWGKIQARYGFETYAGGIVGKVDNGAIYDSLNLNGVHLYDDRGRHITGGSSLSLGVGGITGCVFYCVVSNCYYYTDETYSDKFSGIGRNMGGGQVVNDSQAKTAKEIMSSKFAKQLGDAYVAKDKDRPYLAVMV